MSTYIGMGVNNHKENEELTKQVETLTSENEELTKQVETLKNSVKKSKE